MVRAGRTFPAAVLPLPGVRFAVGEPAPLDPGLAAVVAREVTALRAEGARLQPGPTLALERLEGEVLHLRPADFLDHVGVGRAVTRDPRVRARVTELAGGDPLRSGRGRAAALGVSVVTTVRHGGGRAVVLGRRSPDLPVEPGKLHVVPSGMVEPGPDPVRATAAMELLEELGVAASAFVPLGLGWDLRRLTPEALLRLDLDLDGEEVVAAAPREEFSELVLVDDLARFWHEHGPDELTPPGAAALALCDASLPGPGAAGARC